MGFFSWLTADTEENIWNTYSGMPVRTVYLLRPNGEDPIEEPAYEGYGDFGGHDAFVVLARDNVSAEKLSTLNEEAIRSLGIAIDSNYYLDVETGKKWEILTKGGSLAFDDVNFFSGSYDKVIPEIGMSANQAIAAKRFVTQDYDLKYPLKFSFNKDAVYENLEASKDCPHQGYFAPEEDEEEEDYEDEDFWGASDSANEEEDEDEYED